MTYEYNSHTLYIDNDTKIKTIIGIVYESTNMNNEPTSKHKLYIEIYMYMYMYNECR